MNHRKAPELQTGRWLNVDAPVTLSDLEGRVVVIEAFQMLCPGCVSHGLPQAQRVADTFSRDDVVVLGLHTVFEHHEAQGSYAALAAFLHEYRISFPVAMDAPGASGPIPQTMASYGLQGTPSLILIDAAGFVRKQSFGREPDLLLGAEIMALIRDNRQRIRPAPIAGQENVGCDDSGCRTGGRRN